MARNNKSKIYKKLRRDYRLVIMNHDNLEVRMSLKLNRIRVFVLGGISAFLLIIVTSLLIAFTPIKEYIPGYSSTTLKKSTIKLNTQVDSLVNKTRLNDSYIQGIRALLTGDIKMIDMDSIESIQKIIKPGDLNLNASHQDSIFRQKIEEEDRYSVLKQATKKTEIVFFSPVKGNITSKFNYKNKHFAIDVAVAKNTPIKSVGDGTVIFTGFTADTGYVLIIEHAQNFLSIYKHNASLFKEQGELVLSGEVIANSGSTGSLTTGPHLHFELWNNGYPVNPLDYIEFEK